jgi:hypothetical protein
MKKLILLTFCLIASIISDGQTYFGYEERDSRAYVDWGQIGSDLSYDLKSIASDRTAKKQYFATITRETLQKVSYHDFSSKYSGIDNLVYKIKTTTENEINTLYSDLTSGRIDPNYYEKYLHNINDQFNLCIQIFQKIETNLILTQSSTEKNKQSNTKILVYSEQTEFKFAKQSSFKGFKYYQRQDLKLIEMGMEMPMRTMFDKIIQICNE